MLIALPPSVVTGPAIEQGIPLIRNLIETAGRCGQQNSEAEDAKRSVYPPDKALKAIARSNA